MSANSIGSINCFQIIGCCFTTVNKDRDGIIGGRLVRALPGAFVNGVCSIRAFGMILSTAARIFLIRSHTGGFGPTIDAAESKVSLNYSRFLDDDAVFSAVASSENDQGHAYAMRSSGTLSTAAIFFKAAVVPFLRPLSRSER
jgi:hypothetical protein